jgi:sigma54-dependent transcription regulator
MFETEKQKELAEKIWNLSRELLSTVRDGLSPETLTRCAELLEERRRCIEEVERLNHGPQTIPSATAELFRQAWELDQQSRAHLQEHLTTCRNLLVRLQSARQLLRTRRQNRAPGSFVDRQG